MFLQGKFHAITQFLDTLLFLAQNSFILMRKVVRIEAKFAIKLPESLPSEVASPFICGGGTMFEPVIDYVRNGSRVAIASIGGLGTAGIKFSKSFGGYVTALSRSEDKRDKALGAGADEFYGETYAYAC
jgi:D-arabinose 1-dehydrogenase-like Zn-dependent alcohol dehydrogenase